MKYEFSYFSKTVCPPGAPILPNLLCYRALAVAYYSCALDVLHIRQTRRLPIFGLNNSKTLWVISSSSKQAIADF
jgi:hypothetical protein